MDYKTIKENFEKAVDGDLDEISSRTTTGGRHPANFLAGEVAKYIKFYADDALGPMEDLHFALKSYNVDPGKLEAALKEELNVAIMRAMMKSPYQTRGSQGPNQGPFKVSKGWFEMSREERAAFTDDPSRGGEGF